MCGTRGGIGVPTPRPGKSQVIWVSIKNQHLDPPGKSWTLLENVRRSLNNWKSIVFSVIKPLDPLCKLQNKLKKRKKKKAMTTLFSGRRAWTSPP